MSGRAIKTALISVYHKDGLEPLARELQRLGVTFYSTGGTWEYLRGLGLTVTAVEEITAYPSILGGRVKTLHPKVFGGILARRETDHLAELESYAIPEIDLVVVDLYPFEETAANSRDEAGIIEKIDIGGISLIRAAAKNYRDVAVAPSRAEYSLLLDLLRRKNGRTDLEDRRELARRAFRLTSHYDTAIYQYFNQKEEPAQAFKHSILDTRELRYGENPHQWGVFHGRLEEAFEQLHGKALSYNNLVDIDAAVGLMAEFAGAEPTFAVIKHTNACGVASRPEPLAAWRAALAGDPVSAFGGIIVANRAIDRETARAIDEIFYEALIAPGFTDEALALLKGKESRILLRCPAFAVAPRQFRSLLNGVIEQAYDDKTESAADLHVMTQRAPSAKEIEDLLFANICVKHLKSNAIALVKDRQLIGMGCGQTSRVDALRQAIAKAKALGFDLSGAVMASDAFFPFPDCVEIAHHAGVSAVVQPAGSIRDAQSVAWCDAHQMAMVKTGIRHFKH
jgi:phosphoribosylaminoimidazolecarboxamide formyltransferase/IMP cyclohydrolase